MKKGVIIGLGLAGLAAWYFWKKDKEVEALASTLISNPNLIIDAVKGATVDEINSVIHKIAPADPDLANQIAQETAQQKGDSAGNQVKAAVVKATKLTFSDERLEKGVYAEAPSWPQITYSVVVDNPNSIPVQVSIQGTQSWINAFYGSVASQPLGPKADSAPPGRNIITAVFVPGHATTNKVWIEDSNGGKSEGITKYVN